MVCESLLVCLLAQGFFQRADPKIQTLVFHRDQPPYFAKKKVGVLEFPTPAAGEPGAPSFGDLFHQLLLSEDTANRVAFLEGVSWDREKLTEDQRVTAAAAYAQARALDVVVLGRVDSLYRRANDGLAVKVTLRVVSAAGGEVLWFGSKQADWIRYFPLEDCLRTLANSFLDDLLPPAPKTSRQTR